MKSTLLCAAALAAISTPAVARDNSAYFGLEVGALHVKDTDVEVDDFDLLTIDHKLGVDGDMIAGYDFGMFRLEAELAYKRSEHSSYEFDGDEGDGEGRTSAYSGMINGMVDVGQERDINFYAGAGAGYAQIIHVLEEEEDSEGFKLKDRGFAWQLFAGVRKQLDRHFDVGLKYRYFDGGTANDTVDGERVSTDYNSHSLLLSLIHNFNVEPPRLAPPPPPPPLPPPPPPPATKTCPDGSVVLETDPCPLPPPPPPPPPPIPERG